jgi:hypothetical protein
MYNLIKSREIKNCNSTRKMRKIKNSAAPVDREKNSLEPCAAGFFNLSELRTLLRFLKGSLSRDLMRLYMGSTLTIKL